MKRLTPHFPTSRLCLCFKLCNDHICCWTRQCDFWEVYENMVKSDAFDLFVIIKAVSFFLRMAYLLKVLFFCLANESSLEVLVYWKLSWSYELLWRYCRRLQKTGKIKNNNRINEQSTWTAFHVLYDFASTDATTKGNWYIHSCLRYFHNDPDVGLIS